MIPENREAVLQELRKTVETNLTFLAPPKGPGAGGLPSRQR